MILARQIVVHAFAESRAAYMYCFNAIFIPTVHPMYMYYTKAARLGRE